MPSEQTFLGQTELVWIALTAIGTFVLAAVTVATLVVLRAQLIEGRHAQASGIIERSLTDLSRWRVELYEMRAKVKRQLEFSWDELRVLRNVVFGYQSFVPALEAGIRHGDKASMVSASGGYLDEIGVLLNVVGYANDKVGNRIVVLRADVLKSRDALFDLMETSADERSEYVRLRESDSEAASRYLSALRAKFLVSKGISAADLSEMLREKSDVAEFRYSDYAEHGVDVENMALLDSWVDEIGEMLERTKSMLKTVQVVLEAA
ncbi:MAG: hypothetical protein EPO51_03025 [Phenylobacterium sp.]|uniref:hypothetical protein n=1 Tax=Phenylobacterium sp. TaxID=1871053 RepID=UPI0011F56485|nr:hypothetical protein [Phenylobacterium sp.]TAJ73827.1 MAG: hypothetical protein EPO51_03025 [Phenylobacterium sp.]